MICFFHEWKLYLSGQYTACYVCQRCAKVKYEPIGVVL